MTDQTELDEIMSGEGEATPSTEATVTPEATPEAKTEANRDDKGRFAAKAEDPAPKTEAPVEATPAEPEHERQAIPPGALKAEREKGRQERERAERLERELAEMRGQMQVLMHRQQPAQPQEEQPKPADFWDDPNQFVSQALTPVQQQMQQQNERWSKRFAEQQHGAEKVQEAFAAMRTALQSDPAARADYQRIMSSDHPYGDLVDWHMRQQTMRTVGNDPNKWLEAEMEKRLSDPAEQAKILERIRAAASANTNRSPPVTNLPPTLSRLPGAGNVPDDGDMSDAALFSNALK